MALVSAPPNAVGAPELQLTPDYMLAWNAQRNLNELCRRQETEDPRDLQFFTRMARDLSSELASRLRPQRGRR